MIVAANQDQVACLVSINLFPDKQVMTEQACAVLYLLGSLNFSLWKKKRPENAEPLVNECVNIDLNSRGIQGVYSH